MIAALLDLALLPVWVATGAMVLIMAVSWWLMGGGKRR